MTNYKKIIQILLLASILYLHILLLTTRTSDKNQEELINIFEKRLTENEKILKNSIQELDKKLNTTISSDTITTIKIEELEQSLDKIISNKNNIQDEKLKNEADIINDSDSSDWNWFQSKFADKQ